jgi:glycosyltransferase involved in cell wall biosynthesis
VNDRPWLLVAGDLTPLGGMDRANHALACYLGASGRELHVVTHRAWPDVAALPSVTVHGAWRPFGRHALGSGFLARGGRRVLRALEPGGRHVHAVVNGGNCAIPGANWVHYLHAAYVPHASGSAGRRAKTAALHRRDARAEAGALARARVVISNSERTKTDLVERLGIPESRIHVVYYGSDPVGFSYVDAAARRAAKQRLARPGDRPLVGFVGALGDRRKGFDSVFSAWRSLAARKEWDADLAVAGAGAELDAWKARVEEAGLASRIAFLGFRSDVPDVMAAFDALIHPARYEAYGLSAHEALCRGVPAIVSARAGVAEMYPAGLAPLLISNPDDAQEVAERLMDWRRNLDRVSDLVRPVSERLRARTWDQMAAEIVSRVEEAA